MQTIDVNDKLGTDVARRRVCVSISLAVSFHDELLTQNPHDEPSNSLICRRSRCRHIVGYVYLLVSNIAFLPPNVPRGVDRFVCTSCSVIFFDIDSALDGFIVSPAFRFVFSCIAC